MMKSAMLLAAALAAGLMAGLFAAFSYAVMPGLGMSSDKTFVEAMRNINVAILNPWFMVCFMGGAVVGIAALIVHRRSGRAVLVWTAAGLALFVVMFLITSAFNVPLNDALAKAGNAHLAAVRQRFEGPWNTWNLVRTLASVGSFAAFSWALVLYGRYVPKNQGLPSGSVQAYSREP
ncbi:DUF1772 domain-containing protein [Nonomuraea sp. NPDC050536]|uniref:DUF1772 domain-containing protein n=1 Tax=Nonomuraea sp. NPDC050536 TaxID=3364366 RepID=UPI0037C6E0E3